MTSVIDATADRVLAGPIGECTRWVVISGPPSSGKTTLLAELARRGFRTSHDVSREYLQSLLSHTFTKYDVRSNEAALQEAILARMLNVEGGLPVDERVFLEYALPDNLAFCELGGVPLTSKLWRAAVRFRYGHVFLLDPLPFIEDDVRVESVDYQYQLADKLASFYTALGYRWTRVPVESTEARVKFVLQVLESEDSESQSTARAPEAGRQ